MRRPPKNGTIVNMGVFTDSNTTVYVDPGLQNDTLGNFGTGIDQAPGANNGRFVNFSLRVNKCGRMNHGTKDSFF